MMKTFYNGYCFSYLIDDHLYNPTLANYFFKHFQKNCEYPHDMLDSNFATDRARLRYISKLPYGEELIVQLLNDQSITVSSLSNCFGIEDMIYMKNDVASMASLLYYSGLLTLGQRDLFGKFMLNVPNQVVRKLYAEEIREILLPDLRA